MKTWMAIVASAVVALTFAALAAPAAAHPQPVNQDCLGHLGPGGSPHPAVTPVVTNVTATTATVTWIDLCNQEDEFRVIDGIDNVLATVGPNADDEATASLTNLTCGTTYTIFVQAYAQAGSSSNDATSNSLTATFTTLDCDNDPEPGDCDELDGNHGQYVSCIARSTESGPGKGQIVSNAARSNIGKPNNP